jgi:molybdopterin/thiamine biosynthesis adenylyltransferase
MLTDEQLKRYARQIMLREIGPDGQNRLLNSRVLVVGAGGLGTPVLLYLAAAGVGKIGIVDDDEVSISNLQRQVMYTCGDVGRSKTLVSSVRVAALNPDVNVVAHSERFTRQNGHVLAETYDFVIDATDNFASKFLIADVCAQANTPYCHAGVRGFEGQVMTVLPGKTACYRCLFEEEPPGEAEATCKSAGILGPVAGTLGCIQATEALKFMLGTGELLTNRLLTLDLATMRIREVRFERNPECPICGSDPLAYGSI